MVTLISKLLFIGNKKDTNLATTHSRARRTHTTVICYFPVAHEQVCVSLTYKDNDNIKYL